MFLTEEEKSILDGQAGEAKQKAMEFMVENGEALGAERLVKVTSVAVAGLASSVSARNLYNKGLSLDSVFSEYMLNCHKGLDIPCAEAFSFALMSAVDKEQWKNQYAGEDVYRWALQCEEFERKRLMHGAYTCAPYLVGMQPVFGEHCAWMESSAVGFCNSVIGARTNTEGNESSGAAALIGRVPYWGLHIKENRYATQQVIVECSTEENMDWGILGYFTGRMAQEQIAVISGITAKPDLPMLKHACAAAASSGGVELFHIAGKTPEANTVEEALNHKKPKETFVFGEKEKREIYEYLNRAKDPNVDYIMIGCPHANLKEIWEIVRLLDGRKINSRVSLWIFTPGAIKAMCDRQGYTEIIEKAGGHLMADSCPVVSGLFPPKAKVAATNSAKQAHYMPALSDMETWFGSTKDCIEAAVSGIWKGGL